MGRGTKRDGGGGGVNEKKKKGQGKGEEKEKKETNKQTEMANERIKMCSLSKVKSKTREKLHYTSKYIGEFSKA